MIINAFFFSQLESIGLKQIQCNFSHINSNQQNLMSILVQSQTSIAAGIEQNDNLPSRLQDTSILKQKMKQLEQEIQSLQILKTRGVSTQKKTIRSQRDQQTPIQQLQNSKQIDLASSSKFSQNFKNNKISDLVSQLSFKDEPGRQRKRSYSKTVYTGKHRVPNFQQTFNKIDLLDKKEQRVSTKIFQLKGINQQMESNIYNLTIAEIMSGQHKTETKSNQKKEMMKEIKELKSMVKEITVQNESRQKKSLLSKQSLTVDQNTLTIDQNTTRLPIAQNALTLPAEQTTARKSVQSNFFKQDKSFKLNLQQNTQRTIQNPNAPMHPFEQGTFRSQILGTGKIYNRSRVVKNKNVQELMMNTMSENAYQNQMHSIQLRRNTNPFTWNPQINLTLAHKPYSIQPNKIRSGKIYSSIDMKKRNQQSEEKAQEFNKKPAFHIMKKKNIGLKRKETINIEVQTSFQQVQVKDPEPKKLEPQTEPVQLQPEAEQESQPNPVQEEPKKQPKKPEQRLVHIKINKFKQNQQPPKQFLPNFREYINEKLLSITLPVPPTLQEAQSDLDQLGRTVFQLFDVYVDQEIQNKGTEYKVTKYKNCVQFKLNQEKNIVWYFDGKFYFGGWEINLIGEGKKEGFGFEIIPQVHSYQGFFKNSKRDGYGIISHYSPDGATPNIICDGFWKEGLKQGKCYQIEDELQYLGDFKQGIQTGFCQIKTEQAFYQGQIKESIKQGKGSETLKNGDQYRGEFKQNMFHGIGQYKWKSGAYFYGSFSEGKRKGEGIWISNMHSDSFDIYKGCYDENRKNGYGIYRWANGTIYEGCFKNDLRHDQGLMIFPNGKAAKFLWKDGNKTSRLYSQQEEIYRRNRNSKNNAELKDAQDDNQQLMEEKVTSNNRTNFLQQVLDELNGLNLVLYKQHQLKKQKEQNELKEQKEQKEQNEQKEQKEQKQQTL